ncbi:hypothetical protein KSP40_PGU005714 [Platanthera guangdongensis]|uniref:Uncharacterized protein n=1 Tax=Platanthera guangdongensis TaxID=2320717 RepID=A0ABR2LSE7_9ASPA
MFSTMARSSCPARTSPTGLITSPCKQTVTSSSITPANPSGILTPPSSPPSLAPTATQRLNRMVSLSSVETSTTSCRPALRRPRRESLPSCSTPPAISASTANVAGPATTQRKSPARLPPFQVKYCRHPSTYCTPVGG